MHFHLNAVPETFRAVHTSTYSTLFGIPVAILGILGYGLLWLSTSRKEPHESWTYLISLIGITMSARLMYGSIFVIHKLCPFCVASAIIMTVIFVIALKEIWKEGDREDLVIITIIWGVILVIALIIISIFEPPQRVKAHIELTQGRYARYSYSFESSRCACSSGSTLTLIDPNNTEKHLFYDKDSNGDIGSCNEDAYQLCKDNGSITYTSGSFTIKNLRNIQILDPNEAIAIANAEYQGIMKIISIKKE
jgi:uncharacterized membrane protein